MANIFDDKNVRIGATVGGLLGAVAPIATMGDKLTFVDIVIGAVVVGAVGLGIGYLVTFAKRQQLLDNESKVNPSQLLANESNTHSETSAIKTQHARKSPKQLILAWIVLAVAFIVAYSLVPRSELENRTVLASLFAPNEGSSYVQPYECMGLPSGLYFGGRGSCIQNGGLWMPSPNSSPSLAERFAAAGLISPPPDAGEVVSADFEKALPFLVIIAGIVGASIFISSRSKKHSTE
jgi:hypothetical protein